MRRGRYVLILSAVAIGLRASRLQLVVVSRRALRRFAVFILDPPTVPPTLFQLPLLLRPPLADCNIDVRYHFSLPSPPQPPGMSTCEGGEGSLQVTKVGFAIPYLFRTFARVRGNRGYFHSSTEPKVKRSARSDRDCQLIEKRCRRTKRKRRVARSDDEHEVSRTQPHHRGKERYLLFPLLTRNIDCEVDFL